jgi:putative sterol carrier protein
MSSTAVKKLNSVDEVIASMPERFNPQNCKDLQAVYQWALSEPERFFYVIIDKGNFEVIEGKHDKPNVTVICSQDTYLKLVNKELKDIIAILTKRLMVKGSMSLGQKLSKIFI